MRCFFSVVWITARFENHCDFELVTEFLIRAKIIDILRDDRTLKCIDFRNESFLTINKNFRHWSNRKIDLHWISSVFWNTNMKKKIFIAIAFMLKTLIENSFKQNMRRFDRDKIWKNDNDVVFFFLDMWRSTFELRRKIMIEKLFNWRNEIKQIRIKRKKWKNEFFVR